MHVRETAKTYPSEKKSYTYEDYLELPDDRNRYEILDGELIMTPSPVTVHQRVIRKLSTRLNSFVEKHKLGEVFWAPYDVVLTNTNVVEPDILFVANANKKIVTSTNIKGAPDLIIEVLSPTTAYYDLIEKKELYEKFGVKEYWIVDPKKQWVEIYILDDRKYKLHQREEKSGKINSKILKGFELKPKEIFSEEG